MSWADTTREKPKALLLPPHYADCFRRALLRMSVTINTRRHPSRLPPRWLRLSDGTLENRVRDAGLDRKLYVLQEVRLVDRLPATDVLENFFYASFRLDVVQTPHIRRVIYNLPFAFLDQSYRGLHPPPFRLAQLGFSISDNPYTIMATCATNYIIKNFWHNYVHNELQRITHDNYRSFGGNARFESDFEADNLATILLVKSYGLPIRADNLNDPEDERVVELLRRNRCNEVFAIRARGRGETRARTRGSLTSFLDDEWKLRRAIAIYVSGRLVASGRAPASLGVYLTGKPERQGERFRRKATKIVVQINGLRIATPFSPWSRAHGTEGYRDYLREIAESVVAEYTDFLRSRPAFRDYVRATLSRKLDLAGV